MAEKVLKKLIKLFHLESMVVLDRPLAYREALPQNHGGVQHIFSFIPEDYDRHDVLVKGIREANYFLSLVQEAYDFQMPIAFVYLSQKDFCNAYSNEGADDSYIISYTTSLFTPSMT